MTEPAFPFPPPSSFSTAEDLRRGFDQTFAAAPSGGAAAFEPFVAIRVGEDPFALRFDDITGIEAGKSILPLPVGTSGALGPGFLGICGLRGRVVPVYSLARLCGHRETGGGERHWLALVGREQPIGITFSAVEGHLRVPRQDIKALGDAQAHPYARHVLHHAGTFRLVLDMAQIAAATHTDSAARAPSEGPPKE